MPKTVWLWYLFDLGKRSHSSLSIQGVGNNEQRVQTCMHYIHLCIPASNDRGCGFDPRPCYTWDAYNGTKKPPYSATRQQKGTAGPFFHTLVTTDSARNKESGSFWISISCKKWCTVLYYIFRYNIKLFRTETMMSSWMTTISNYQSPFLSRQISQSE